MRFWESRGRPTNDPGFSSFLVLASATIIGLWIGETLFSWSYGLPRADWRFPWWYSTLFALGAVLLLLRCEGRMFRIALGLFAARQILAAADPTLLYGGSWAVREMLLVAAAATFALAGWPAAHRWPRVLACVLCVAAVPVRYQMLQAAHEVRSVVHAREHIGPTEALWDLRHGLLARSAASRHFLPHAM
jgi:hypothetical protein